MGLSSRMSCAYGTAAAGSARSTQESRACCCCVCCCCCCCCCCSCCCCCCGCCCSCCCCCRCCCGSPATGRRAPGSPVHWPAAPSPPPGWVPYRCGARARRAQGRPRSPTTSSLRRAGSARLLTFANRAYGGAQGPHSPAPPAADGDWSGCKPAPAAASRDACDARQRASSAPAAERRTGSAGCAAIPHGVATQRAAARHSARGALAPLRAARWSSSERLMSVSNSAHASKRFKPFQEVICGCFGVFLEPPR
jgi:hypothetical protein